jgi:catechol 2,3-dioxygenase-like lactoylglutathione lyase family enzyme
MRLMHAGLVSSSERRAERFFGGVLGFEQTRRSQLSAELGKSLFGFDEGCEILYYGGGDLELEVFVTGRPEVVEGKISHLCLEVVDRDQVLARCAELGFAVRQAPKADYVVVFIADEDGNLFEIKEKR